MYILTLTEGDLKLLDVDMLSAYVLSDSDIQYITDLSSNTSALTSTLNSELLAKIGPGAANKQTLNATYVQQSNVSGFTTTDLENFKTFIKDELVGYKIVDVNTLEVNESVE